MVVVGGGISGLAAAYFLATGPARPHVTVLEQDSRIGGKLHVAEVDGIPVDQGAESLLARRPEAVDLARAVGLDGDVVYPATSQASIWSRGAFRRLPAGTVMGVPTDLRDLAASGVLSLRGLARIPLDHLLPWTRHVAERDVPIGWYVRQRVGREVVDRLVDPLLGGVYAGHADELSLGATVPTLALPAHRHRALLAATMAARAATASTSCSTNPVRRRCSPRSRGGLGRLPAAVAEASGATIRTGRAVRELRRTPVGWQLVVGPTRDPEIVDADAVVLSCPAAATRRLLGSDRRTGCPGTRRVESASVALVTLVFDDVGVRDRLEGSGFLVPAVEGRLIKAATYLTRSGPGSMMPPTDASSSEPRSAGTGRSGTSSGNPRIWLSRSPLISLR